MQVVRRLFLPLVLLTAVSLGNNAAAEKLKCGIIGCDTSHVPAFTRVFNDPAAEGNLADIQVVAAYPGGSDDIEASYAGVEKFTEQLREMGVEIVDSVDALVEKVDVVLLESVDGRPHLEQVRPVLAAGKPVFIDKPVAGSLADAIEIFRLAKQHDTPCFSSSSLRFSPEIAGLRYDPLLGKVVGVNAYGPCSLEPHHPDLYWYGVHGVEVLFALMGTGCVEVQRTHTEGTDFVVGRWEDGRVGTFRGIREGKAGYGAQVFGTKGIGHTGKYAGYKPLVEEIARFFKSGKPPVTPEETLEMFAFMEAADESKRQGGKPVTIAEVIKKAGGQADESEAAAK